MSSLLSCCYKVLKALCEHSVNCSVLLLFIHYVGFPYFHTWHVRYTLSSSTDPSGPPLRLQKLSVRLKSLMREKYSAANVLHLTTIGISGERVYAAKRLHRNRSNSLQNVMPALPFAAAESPGV